MLAIAHWLEHTSVSQEIQKALWLIPLLQTIHIIAIAMALSSVLMETEPVRRQQTTLPHVIAIGGGVPIKVGNDVIGGVGLSGSPGVDEPCVNAGIDKVKDQLQ